MPFVGQAVTGNPKRLFVGAKDRIVLNTGDQQSQSNMAAIKDGFTQVERALNTRAVTAKTENAFGGPNIITMAVINTDYILPPGTKQYDTGTILTGVTNAFTIREAGIYLCTMSPFITSNNATGGLYLVKMTRYNQANAIQDLEQTAGSVPSTAGFSLPLAAQFSCNYKDYIQITAQRQGGGATDTAQLLSLAIIKLGDVPSPAGV